MNRLLLISALCGGLALPGHAQSIRTWIEELAALQTLEHTIQQGYQTVSSGLQTIDAIRRGEYGLHSTYFSSLDRVKPVVTGDPRVQALRSRLTALIAQLQAALDYWKRQPIVSP
ncbi:hypothetical protein [Puia dinghuensis]|uniref:Conjugal transfer protein n=1 Tax=Puia dinghuensis TaxID=1792502 RepID=A0A8J2XU88_9BACT|nr:hypothetical protein [Puia dinghuensis]GGB23877.1 hypothetical protein GCM10011511_54710 [Puia dinghuensis]